jgi:biopolymer transport protein ExbD
MIGIKIQLPGVNPPPPGPKDFISIRVGAGGIVSFNGEVVLDEQVLPRLFQLHAANPDVKVSISAEGMARHGDVITVLDRVRQAEIKKVGYQIRAAGGGAPAPGAPGAPGAPPGAPPPPPPH